MLDTATGGDAERLYGRLGWRRCGVIPGYALLPHGGLCGTTVFYRELVSDGADAEPEGVLSKDARGTSGSVCRDEA